MNDKIILISDFFIDDFVGGAALNDEEVFKILNRHYEVTKIKSQYVYPGFIEENPDSFFIISNFFGLSPAIKELLEEKCKYILYCHDYKFIRHTNPAVFPEFKVPPAEIINKSFHNAAARIICQTNFQKHIYDKNLNLPHKTINFSGNLWSEDSLDLMEKYSSVEKNGRGIVIDSPFPQKGTDYSINFCKEKKWNFDLVSDPVYESFLNKLSQYSKLVFHPGTPETCCRLVLEAKMMNLEIVTNDLIGASYEPWFPQNGKELINTMRNKREGLLNIIREARNSK